MIEIPKQLQDKTFRFCKIHEGTKRPVGHGWQSTENYTFDEHTFVEYLKTAEAYGVVGGHGKLGMLDCDNEVFQDWIMPKLPTTFTQLSGGKHFAQPYLLFDKLPDSFKLVDTSSETPTGKPTTIADFQGVGHQLIGVGSKFELKENGKAYDYQLSVDAPIVTVKYDEFIELIRQFCTEYPSVEIQGEGMGGASNESTGKILCPFHDDTNPSLNTFANGTFFCYGCKTHGFVHILTLEEPKKSKKYKTRNNSIMRFVEREEVKQYQALMQKESIPEPPELTNEDVEILKNPALLDVLDKELDKVIVDEKIKKRAMLLNLCKCMVKNKQAPDGLLVNGESSVGKSFTAGKVFDLFPFTEKDGELRKIRFTRISPTAIVYWLRDKKINLDGLIIYLEDVSEQVLNHETTKVMMSEGVDNLVTIRQKAVRIKASGCPTIIMTTANSLPTQEVLNRMHILKLDHSEKQTEAIKERQSELARTGIKPEYDVNVTKALRHLKRCKVVIPYAEHIAKWFSNNVKIRRYYPSFLDLIMASAALHQFSREVSPEGFIIASGQDYDVAVKHFSYEEEQIPHNLEVALNICRELEPPFSVKQAYEAGSSVTLKVWYDYINKLTTMGKLRVEYIKGDWADKKIAHYTIVKEKESTRLPESFGGLQGGANIQNIPNIPV